MLAQLFVAVLLALTTGATDPVHPLDGCWRVEAHAPGGARRLGELRVRFLGTRASLVFYWRDNPAPTRRPTRLALDGNRVDYADRTEQGRADLTLVGALEHGFLVGVGSAADWGPRGAKFRLVAVRAGPDLCR